MGHIGRSQPSAAVADGGDQLRLFVAIEIPQAQKLSVEKAIQPLRLALPKARWTTREQWHATLKFLGELPEERLSEVTEIVGRAADGATPTETRLTEIGSFPHARRARVLWVGLEDAHKVMSSLASSMEEEFGRAGFRKEGRELHPHLTLARFRVPQPIEKEIAFSGPFEFDRSPFEVTETVLFRSHLSPRGATYEALEKFPLA